MKKYTLKPNELFVVKRNGVTAYFQKITNVCRYLGINTDVFKRLFTDHDYASYRQIFITIEDCPDLPYSEVNKYIK